MKKRNLGQDEDFVGLNDVRAIQKSMADAAARKQSVAADVAYGAGMMRSRQAKFQEFDDKLNMQGMARRDEQQASADRTMELYDSMTQKENAFADIGKEMKKAMAASGYRNAGMSTEDKWKANKVARIAGVLPSKQEDMGKRTFMEMARDRAELSRVSGVNLGQYGGGGGGASNTRAKARNDAKESQRTQARMATKAMEDAQNSPFRTKTDEEIKAERMKKTGLSVDRLGKTWEDTSFVPDRSAPTSFAATPKPQASFRTIGTRPDPLRMNAQIPYRLGSEPKSMLDDIMPFLGVSQSSQSTVLPAQVSPAAKQAAQSVFPKTKRKGLINGMPARQAIDEELALSELRFL